VRFISMTRRLGVAQPGRLQTGIPFARQVGRKLRQIRSSAPIEAALAHVSSQPRSRSSLIFSRACRLGSASFKPADHRLAGRSGRLRPVCPPQRPQCARAACPSHPRYPRQPALTHPLYLYLLGWHSAPLYGWSSDPGRDVLWILISPPRWLQWP
jgi:hypothetical protein